MDLIELTKKLIEFPSYTGNQKAIDDCLEHCIEYFEGRKGIFIKRERKDGLGSVLISNCNTKNFDILEIGHVDVVPVKDDSMFKARIEGDKMYGRGTADMKGSVATAMKVFDYVIEKKLNLKYGLLIVCDEEIGGFTGAKHWAEDLSLRTKILFDADTGLRLNKIINKSKACFFITLISEGKTSHGSKPWLGIDAVENLIKTINNIRKIFPYISENNNPKDKWITTMHVGTIKGGTAINAIAAHAEANIDFRYTEKYTFESLCKIITENLEPGVKLITNEKGILVFNDVNNEYLQLYKKVVEEKTGEKAIFDFSTGASDSRYFINVDKNTIIIGNQANCDNLHGDGEFVEISSLKKLFEIRKIFLERLKF